MSLQNQFEETISGFFPLFLLKILPKPPLMLSQLSVCLCAIIAKPFGQLVIR